MKEAVEEARRQDLAVRAAAHLQIVVRRLPVVVRPEEAQLAGRPEVVVDRPAAALHSEVALLSEVALQPEVLHHRFQPTSKPSGSSALELAMLAALSR